MSQPSIYWLYQRTLRSLSLILCLTVLVPSLALAQSADEIALRTLTEKFFAAYQSKDLNGLMRWWSAKSPDLAASQQSFEQSFAAIEKVELKSLAIRKLTIDGDKAMMRVAVEINAVEAKTGKPASGFGKLNRTLQFVKEVGEWKLSRYVPSEEALAAALAAAKTDEERQALLVADKELITVELQSALATQGKNLVVGGSYPQATRIYQVALSIAEQLGDKKGMATALRGLGRVHYFQGRYPQALELYQKSLKLAEEIGDKQDVANVLRNIAGVHHGQGNMILVLGYLQKSMKLAEEIGDKQALAGGLIGLGLVHRAQGNYAQALMDDQRSLTLAEEIGDKEIISYALSGIGKVHEAQGNHAQELEYLQKGLKLAEEIGDKSLISEALIGIGYAHYIQDHHTQALEYLQKSMKLSEEIGDKSFLSGVMIYIGKVHEAQGNLAQAMEDYQKSLTLAEEIGDKQDIMITLDSIGTIHYRQGDYAQAVGFAERAATIAHQVGGAEGFSRARTTAGRAYRALNQPEQARLAFTEAIDTIEKLRSQVAGGAQQQQSFFETRVAPYYEMVDLLIDQHNPAEALAYAERAKGRVLLDVLSRGKINITKAMTKAEQDQERKLNGELVSLNSQVFREKALPQPDDARLQDINARLQKARLDYEAFQTSLYAAHPELKVHRAQMQPLTLDEALKLIPDQHTALLEFAITEDRTFLFVLTRKAGASQAILDLRAYTLNIKQKELADAIRRFSQRLANRRLGFQEMASQLYDLLLKPARTQLQNISALAIVPDGVLWELPFQALQPARDRYLIEDYAISYAPSLTVLREMMKQRSSPTHPAAAAPTLLAFGNPAFGRATAERVKTVFMDEQLEPLPEAERQVKSLGRLYGAGRSKIYIGTAAREEQVKAGAGHCRILHLATHAILNDASPMYSQVVLAQPQPTSQEDGLLEAWEIMKLDIQADLVVLSACDTARGRVGAGEGVIGLSWALFVAGCPTTVVSQWKVESASTTELMIAFHRKLKASASPATTYSSRAEALRQAALKLLRSKPYSHPFYWAAFVVVGDAS